MSIFFDCKKHGPLSGILLEGRHLRVDISSRFITSHPGLLEIDFSSWRNARGNLQASWEDCSICKSAL